MNLNSNQEQAFLKRLTAIVEANLGNEQFGVSELAEKTGMSRSFLHRHLKSITNQSVSKFIREVRLDKAKQLLDEGKLTVSEIAYNVGFGSPSYFIKCFHDFFGYAPGEMKKNLMMNENTSDREYDSVQKKHSKPFKIIIISTAIILLSAAVWFLYQQTRGITKKELSIIVLPFKNLSDDPTNEYFAYGIREDILNNLYRIASLRVVSNTTAENFRENTLSAREIARKTNVNFVLEGSVRRYDNKTRISVQLIDPEKDDHLWSDSFDREMNDIINVQKEIALQVADKLRTVLSENEIRQIGKIATQNTKAYDHYLQARFLLHKANSPQRSDFNKVGAMNCIQYYEKAIAEDENFAEAYAGLANAWFNLSAWGYLDSNEGFLKARELSLKAIKIDPDCAEAHSVLGAFLIWGVRKLEEGGKELKTSVQLNPNYANARQWYAQYLMITGPIEEARIHVNRALELEPYFWVVQNLNSWIYYFEEKYEQALEACIIAHDHNPNFSSNNWLFVLNYAKLGEGEKMKQQLQTIAKTYSNSDDYADAIQKAFDKSGIDGLFYWMIEANKNNPIRVEGLNGHPFYIAWWNAILGNEDKALYWLEKVLDEKSIPYHYFNLISTNPDFRILHENPRFLKIVDKIGLTPYHKRKEK